MNVPPIERPVARNLVHAFLHWQRFDCIVARMKHRDPPGVGLGGDGDEIDAIRRVEARFGVKLDVSDASTWKTAGDVYQALRRALPADEADRPEAWTRFAKALAEESADPESIERGSLLFGAAAGATRTALLTAIVAAAVIVGIFVLFH
jgi:hypothetical protein